MTNPERFRATGIFGILLLLCFVTTPAIRAQAWPNGYTYSRTITIDHTKVPNTDQTNFPVLFSGTYAYLATTANGGNVTNSNGYDIIFTSDSAGSTLLSWEVESYNPTTGALNCWVRIPTLSHTTDTVIYLWYGNSSITNFQSGGQGAVWDSNYQLVNHFSNQGGSLSLKDSSQNNLSLTNDSGTSSTGHVGGDISFAATSGAGQYAQVSDGGSSSPLLHYPLTIESWANFSATQPNTYPDMLAKYVGSSNNGWAFLDLGGNSPGQVIAYYFGNSMDYAFSATDQGWGTVSSLGGAWHHYVAVISSNGISYYLDGSLVRSTSWTGTPTQSTTTATPTLAGNSNLGTHGFASGSMDELRISSVARSADWIAASYNNQGSPSPFYSIGGEIVSGPVISQISPSSGQVGTSVTILGTNFGTSQNTSTVSFGGTAGLPTTWTNTSIVVSVPVGATTGNLVVTVDGAESNGILFQVTPAITLTSISVSPSSTSVAVGQARSFTAMGNYSDGSSANLTGFVTWESSSPNIATVNSTGVATGLVAGSTVISASQGSTSNSASLSVQAPVLVSIAVQPGLGGEPVGGSEQFTAAGTFSDGTTRDVSASVTWRSSTAQIATISSAGLATGIAAGAATISASQNGVTGSASLNVSTEASAPQIAVSSLPSANGNGWNNSAVIVTFKCSAGSAAITSCPSPQTVTTEGASQVISGTAIDAVGKTASASVTLNIDKTLPALVVSTPADGSSEDTSGVAVSGTIADNLSGLENLTCNGIAANISGTAFSCNLSFVVGVNLLVVRAADIAGNVASTNVHITETGTLPAPASIKITPGSLTMLVNETHFFSVIDDQGRQRSGVAWSVSDSSIASLSADGSGALSGVLPGQVTLFATVQGVSAEAIVYVNSSIASGGARWSLSPAASFSADEILQAVSTVSGPAVYAIARSATGKLITALGADGQQIWMATVLSGTGTPDNNGGLLLVGQNSVVDLDSQTGAQIWEYAGSVDGKIAVSQNGNIFFRQSASFADPIVAGQTDIQLSIVELDGNTGAMLAKYPIPASSYRYCAGFTTIPLSDLAPNSQLSDPSASPDGTIFANVGFFSSTQACSSGSTGTSSVNLSLLRINTDGSISVTPYHSETTSTSVAFDFSILQAPIPDGHGGILIPWDVYLKSSSYQSHVTDYFDGSAIDFLLPTSNGNNQIALGDSENAFISDSAVIHMFSVSNGSVAWSYPATSPFGNIGIATATVGGGVVVNDSVQGLVSLDANGTAQQSINGFSEGNSWTTPSWTGIISGSFGIYIGPTASPALSDYPTPQGSSNQQNAAPKPIVAHFIPVDPGSQLSAAMLVSELKDKSNVPQNVSTAKYYANGMASANEFLRVVNSSIAAIGFIGHSVESPVQDHGIFPSEGICFSDECIVREGYTAGGAPYISKSTVPNNVSVMFFAACNINSDFLSLWNFPSNPTQAKGRAMIVPAAPTPVDLTHGSLAWIFVVNRLLSGGTVTDAINDANSAMESKFYAERWQVVGDPNARIMPQH